MGVSSSLYASISGLSTMGEAMTVLGDNVANVNTVAFKSSRSTFQDVLSQSVSTAAGSAQVGRGVTLSAIDGLFAQGSFESSSNATDMAIGGQGFFMLRKAESSEADMYSRAGEFRFDQEGYLVTPTGYFVQGWQVSTDTGEREGTIGDIAIDKNTPPVATQTIDVITNLDARKTNEPNEDRLFTNWNGTNAAAIPPTDPIDATKYDYTTAIKIYDSKGASHDISIFYDRTSNDNEWEYLVTCDPTEDLRVMDETDLIIYNPDTRYNYENHRGAGALQYGTLKFDTSGNLNAIEAYKVPPDGQVDPAKTENRLLLEAGESYFKFPSNFTGATEDMQVEVNFGGSYTGQSEPQRQILVSDDGARAFESGGVTGFVNSATDWAYVGDSNGNTMVQGDMFVIEGYKNNSDNPGRLVYTIDETKDVQDFLNKLEDTFDVIAAIDGDGRLKLSDQVSGDSSFYVTRFETISNNNSAPWGGAYQTNPNAFAYTETGITSNGTAVVTESSTSLIGLQGTGTAIAEGAINDLDEFVFEGTAVNGVDVTVAANNTFAVDGTLATPQTIGDLLTFISDLYSDGTVDGNATNAEAVLDADGNIRVIDLAQSGNLTVQVTYDSNPGGAIVAPVSGGVRNPWGMVDKTLVDLTLAESVEAQVNITTSKKMVYAPGRALASDTGENTPITADTEWDTVFDDNDDPTINSGFPRGVNNGDQVVFTGTKTVGTVAEAVTLTYTIRTGETTPKTVQHMLDEIEDAFDCEASIDSAGRLVLTDRVADTISLGSKLSIDNVAINYGYTTANYWDADGNPSAVGVDPANTNNLPPQVDLQHNIFGDMAVVSMDPQNAVPVTAATGALGGFEFINADISSEDGSQVGDVVTTAFDAEALSTSQYANSSTTVFQDQNGYASGSLQSVSVDVEGVMTGNYSNGQVLKKAQVALANFSSLSGLRKEGGNIFTETSDSGAPVTGPPGTNGLGSIAPNALEQSNVDLGTEFVKLIRKKPTITTKSFRA